VCVCVFVLSEMSERVTAFPLNGAWLHNAQLSGRGPNWTKKSTISNFFTGEANVATLVGVSVMNLTTSCHDCNTRSIEVKVNNNATHLLIFNFK